MKKFVGIFAMVFLGLVGLFSVVDFLVSLPWVLDFFSGSISWLNTTLGYEEEIFLAVSALVIAAWAFDREIDRGEKARKGVAGFTFLCVLAAFALLATSIDRLGDGDSWVAIAVADNEVVTGPPDGKTTDKGGVDGGEAPAPGQSSEQLAAGVSSEAGFDPGASNSKGSSVPTGGCTCPSPDNFESSPPRQSEGESGAVEGESFFDESAEEAREAEEERVEEEEEAREEAREEAEFESEMGGF